LTLPVNQNNIRSYFSPDTQFLAFLGGTNTIHLWNSRSNKFSSLTNHNQPVRNVKFDINKQLLFSTDGKTIKILNLNNLRIIDEISVPYDHGITEYNSDSQILVISGENRVSIYKIQENGSSDDLEFTEIVSKEGVESYEFNSDYSLIAFQKDETSVCILDVETKKEECVHEHTFPVQEIRFSNDRKHLISISSKMPETYYARSSPISPIEVINLSYVDHNYLNQDDLPYEENSIIKIRNLEEGREYSISASEVFFSRYDDTVITIDLQPDKSLKFSKRLLTGETIQDYTFAESDTLHFDVEKGLLLVNSPQRHYLNFVDLNRKSRQFGQHDDFINAVAINYKNTYFASASDDRTVKIWNSAGILINQKQYSGNVKQVLFSPDGNLIASVV
jgi:WD40 repeat protein